MDIRNGPARQTVPSTPAEALEIIRHGEAESELYRHACRMMAGMIEVDTGFPKRTAPHGKKFLTIGMTTCNDYDGVYFTIQAIRMFHGEVMEDVDFLVIDNGSEAAHSRSMKALDGSIKTNYRYLPYRSHQATAMKDLIFREATGDFVLVLDSHVLLVPGSLARLIAYLRAHPESNDILQGPLIGDALLESNKTMATHLDSIWRSGGWGQWTMDPRGGDPDHTPFEIGKQGLGLFCCRRAAWPGLNPRLTGYGCEEGYVHDKIRRAGGRALCLPFLIWLHRFERPGGPTYPYGYDDRIRNFMIMHNEMGTGSSEMIRHYQGHLGREVADKAVRLARAEIASPFHAFDAVYCVWNGDRAREAAMRERFLAFSIGRKVRWYAGATTPMDRHVGAVLSHRRIVEEARTQALTSVIVFEDENRFSSDAAAEMGDALAALVGGGWGVTLLEGPAIAYDSSIYETILTLIPDDPVAVARLVAGLEEADGPTMWQALRRVGVVDAGPVSGGPEHQRPLADALPTAATLVSTLPGVIVRSMHAEQEIRFFVNNSNDVIQNFHYKGLFYEAEELQVISDWFKEGDVLLDVGANVGNHAIYAAKILAAKQAIVIEPYPMAISILKRNIELNGISDVVDTSLLGVGFSDSARNAAPRTMLDNLGGTRMDINNSTGTFQLVAGDSVVRGRKIDFIKIDVEGHEMNVLRGLQGTIKDNRPSMFIEVDDRNLEEFVSLVRSMDYIVLTEFKRYIGNINFLLVPGEHAAELGRC